MVRDQWAGLFTGSDDDWEAAVLELFGRVRSFFVNKVGDEANELTQRTFQRLLEVRAAYRGGSPRAFVLGIARRILLEYMKERYREQPVDVETLTVAAIDPRPSSILAGRAEQRLVLEALRQLPLLSQMVLELYYWEDMTDIEIAEILESNANTVRGRRTRARHQLREIVEQLERAAAPASTSMDLERWARSVRDCIGLPPPASS